MICFNCRKRYIFKRSSDKRYKTNKFILEHMTLFCQFTFKIRHRDRESCLAVFRELKESWKIRGEIIDDLNHDLVFNKNFHAKPEA